MNEAKGNLMKNLTDFTHVQGALWKIEAKYYRLHGDGVTPNGCWRVNPRMVGISDIDATTGNDVLTGEEIALDYGTVNQWHAVAA